MANWVNSVTISGDFTEEHLTKIQELIEEIGPIESDPPSTLRELIIDSSVEFDGEPEEEFAELEDYLKSQKLPYNIDGQDSDDVYYVAFWRPGMQHSQEVVVDEDGVPELCEITVRERLKQAIELDRTYTGAEVLNLAESLFSSIPLLPESRIVPAKEV